MRRDSTLDDDSAASSRTARSERNECRLEEITERKREVVLKQDTLTRNLRVCRSADKATCGSSPSLQCALHGPIPPVVAVRSPGRDPMRVGCLLVLLPHVVRYSVRHYLRHRPRVERHGRIRPFPAAVESPRHRSPPNNERPPCAAMRRCEPASLRRSSPVEVVWSEGSCGHLHRSDLTPRDTWQRRGTNLVFNPVRFRCCYGR